MGDDDSTISNSLLNPRTTGEPSPSVPSFSGTAERDELPPARTDNRFHEKVPLDTENVNRQIEEFEESPNPSPVIERGEGGPGRIPVPAPSPIYHTFSIHVLSLLMAFSVLGTLARLGLRALTTYPDQSIFNLAWVQAVGCLIMGFALGIREPLTKFYGPLFTGITAGFCGSLTTFSSWQEDVFAAWSNEGGAPKLWIYDASYKLPIWRCDRTL